MQEFYKQSDLATSEPYKKEFNDDSFELFKIHFPDCLTISNTGYRIIYKNRQKEERSLFNKLGTNYIAYYRLINSTLEKLTEEGLISSPTAIDPRTMEGYEIVMNFLKSNKSFFSSLLPDLGEVIKKRTEIGDKAEIGSEEILKKAFGEDIQIRDTSGLATKTDTHGGQDRIMIKNSKSYSVQIKVCGGVSDENGVSYIKYLGAKLYPNIDIMIFKKGDWYFVFRAKDENGISTLQIYGKSEGYMIPTKYKIKTLKLESRKDI
jgi:hypothetical protein